MFRLIFVMFCVHQVIPIALQGPTLMRYDPCGLGVINFQKIVINKLSMASVNMGIYRFNDWSETNVAIEFVDPVRFIWVSLKLFKMLLKSC